MLSEVRRAVEENDVRKLQQIAEAECDSNFSTLRMFTYALRAPLPKAAKDGGLPTSSIGLMHIAAYYDSLEVMLWLCNKGFSTEVRSRDEFRPIHFAAAGGACEVVAFICSRECSSINSLGGPYGLSAAYFAVMTDSASRILPMLIESGLRVTERIDRFSMLGMAVKRHDAPCVVILLTHMRMSNTGNTGYSALMTAIGACIHTDHTGAVELLLQHGASVTYCDKNGGNALSVACLVGNADVVRMLLNHDVDIRHGNKDIGYPVIWAARSSNPKILRMVIKAGAYVSATWKHGNALWAVCGSRPATWKEMFTILLDAGLDVNDVRTQNGRSMTILSQMLISSQTPADAIHLLLSRGADLATYCPDGWLEKYASKVALTVVQQYRLSEQ